MEVVRNVGRQMCAFVCVCVSVSQRRKRQRIKKQESRLQRSCVRSRTLQFWICQLSDFTVNVTKRETEILAQKSHLFPSRYTPEWNALFHTHRRGEWVTEESSICRRCMRLPFTLDCNPLRNHSCEQKSAFIVCARLSRKATRLPFPSRKHG